LITHISIIKKGLKNIKKYKKGENKKESNRKISIIRKLCTAIV
jgi:hypothetical protein